MPSTSRGSFLEESLERTEHPDETRHESVQTPE